MNNLNQLQTHAQKTNVSLGGNPVQTHTSELFLGVRDNSGEVSGVYAIPLKAEKSQIHVLT